MNFIRIIIITLSMLVLVSCANTQKMNSINVGMRKQTVIQILGEPNSTSAIKGVQYLNYKLFPTSDHAFYGISEDHYVRIVNGKVDAYGRLGDFDSTKIPETKSTINLNLNHN